MFLKPMEQLPTQFQNETVQIYYDMIRQKKVQLFCKRALDILLSAVLLVLLAPFMVVIAVAVKIDSPGPVFYRQERVTAFGKIFRIRKFRTMVANADAVGGFVTLQNDCRITRVGKFLRTCRLDEVPQLFHILVGDMSFVGTRPEVPKYVAAYTEVMWATLLLPAGVTSCASILFQNEDQMLGNTKQEAENIYIQKILPEKMKHNLAYLDKFGLLTDIKIIWDTVISVARNRKKESLSA